MMPSETPFSRLTLVACLVTVLAVLQMGPTPAAAQSRKPAIAAEEIAGNQLVTKDGIALHASFIPGGGNKETVPVILLHDQGGNRGNWSTLASKLGNAGFAVLIPDLRWHGGSTSRVGSSSNSRAIDPEKLPPAEAAKMVRYDMAALRSFLVEKNNDQKLNMNKLVIIGAGMGAAIAVDWAVLDWAYPNYAHTGVQQSRDVKALVLLSPRYGTPGFNTAKGLSAPVIRQRLSIYLAAGSRDNTLERDADRMYKALNASRREPPLSRETEAENTLWVRIPPTSDQGSRLGGGLADHIVDFLNRRVVEGEATSTWIKHK